MNYTELVLTTRNNDLSARDQIINCGLGLAGEAGEVADLIKKWVAQGHSLDVDKVIQEAGDVFWYLENLCICLGVSREEVQARNTAKLRRRFPNGFSAAASINRQA
jgi:NTP pyrophosphatase (non-canonical NTP hydrolase)